MKHKIKLILFFVFVLARMPLSGQTTDSQTRNKESAALSKDATKIREHIDKIFQAYMNKDTVTVRSTHAENWRGFLSFSNKILRGMDEYMNEVRGSDGLNKAKSWRIVNYKMLDYDIVFSHGTGIVSYIAELFWQDGQATGSYKLRSIDIYAKEKNEWIQIASNIGPLPQE